MKSDYSSHYRQVVRKSIPVVIAGLGLFWGAYLGHSAEVVKTGDQEDKQERKGEASEGLLNKLLAPGQLIEGHKNLEHSRCLDCHEPRKGVPDSKCLKCHEI